MRHASCALLLLLLLAIPAVAQRKDDDHGHYYVPLREVEMEFRDFTFRTLDGGPLNLREAAKGKRLVLVHYFAAWCHNSNFDVATVNELYKRYREQGLLVIGVCEYSKNDELREFIARHKPEYPICIEGDEKRKDRTGTSHYAYRKQLDDQRLWGTPLNILLTEELRTEGEIAAMRVRAAPGEMIPTEIDDLIQSVIKKKE